MTGRPGLAIGEHGKITVTPNARGGYQARTSVRDRDGRVREATATGASLGAAERELKRRLETRASKTEVGITADMTIAEASAYWLHHRSRKGRTRGQGAVKPQTLAAYNDAIRLLIVPALGGVRVREMSVGLLDSVLGDLEESGLSTAQARSVLHQLLGLAARHEAIASNPMALVAKAQREPREVEVLNLDQVQLLRHLVRPEVQRRPGFRGPNGDLRDVVDSLLGTGVRISEALAVQWHHLDLEGDLPTVLISGTLVEPKKGYVDELHRQESTKNKLSRRLILPDATVRTLRARRETVRFVGDEDPVFASRTGTWLWPNNIRTRLRAAIEGYEDLVGTTPHSVRRTVGTLVAHERGLDAVREQLGHSDPSVTFQRYVAARELAPDLRDVLDILFVTDA